MRRRRFDCASVFNGNTHVVLKDISMTELHCNTPPFPNQGEILRWLCNAADCKGNQRKRLDDAIREPLTSANTISALYYEFLIEALKKSTSQEVAEFVELYIPRFLQEYMCLVDRITLASLTRQQSLPIVSEHLFAWFAAGFLDGFYRTFGGVSISALIREEASSLSLTFEWLSQHCRDWDVFYSALTKEKKDKIREWSGKQLQTSESLNLLFVEAPLKAEDTKRAKTLLILARIIDFAKNFEIGASALKQVGQFLRFRNPSYDVGLALCERQALLAPTTMIMERLARVAFEIQQKLPFRDLGNDFDQEGARHLIERFSVERNSWANGTIAAYYEHWYNGRLKVQLGNISGALTDYDRAMQASLFRAGGEQFMIWQEAAMVAAIAGRKPLLKRLKKAALLFGWQVGEMNSLTKNEIFAEYEVEHLKLQFSQHFPAHSDNGQSYKIGPNSVCNADLPKPDFRYPDRTFKIGSLRRKKPQLVHFSEHNDVEAISKLLEAGARVNCASETGETPILMAVQQMNVTVDFQEPDDRCFKLLCECKHDPDTLNKKTEKKRLSSLTCAVETGKPWVVEQLLKMGANVDLRAGDLNLTPLYNCLSRLFKLSTPMEENASPERLDILNRHLGGMLGVTSEQMKAAYGRTFNSHRADEIKEIFDELIREHLEKHSSPESFRQIAAMLLQHAADPNSKNNLLNGCKGYTPLMLTAEQNEVDLFQTMIKKGGDPFIYYIDPRTQIQVDCWQIAMFFEADAVLEVLHSSYPNHKPLQLFAAAKYYE